MLDEDGVLVQCWTHVPRSGGEKTAAAVRSFAADHGMASEPQRRVELAVAEALRDAVTGDSGEPITIARVDAALDDESMTVRIEHDGFAASARAMARLGELVEEVESCGPRGRANAAVQFECAMRC